MPNPTSPTRAVLLARTISTAVLSTGFALTGAGTVLLGMLLPVFSQKWGLSDDAAGFLLFLQFAGASLGAVSCGLNRIRSIALGYGLLVASSLDLAFAHSRAPFTAFFLFGLGLGMAMTSTNLLISDRARDERAAKLEWLNFAWSLGATTCPLLLLPLVRRSDTHQVYVLLLVAFFLLLAWVAAAERQEKPVIATAASNSQRRPIDQVFLLLLICALCTVGVESALTGWLTTYSHRTGMRSLAGSALATAVFWLGEMVSRLAFSTPLLKKIGRQTVLKWGICGATASAIFLIAAPHPSIIIASAGIAGIFTGPLYPILLSYLLERSARGWLFAVAGLGAAFFPWMTGLVSAHLNSLRLGLLVPCFGYAVMLAFGALIFRPAQTGAR